MLLSLLVSLVQLLFSFDWVGLVLLAHVLGFQVVVVEFCVKVLVVIDPRAHHMWVLFRELRFFRLSMQQHWLVKADVVSFKSLIAPKHVLTPKVGVLAAGVHGSIRFELLLNEVLIFEQGQLNVFGVSIGRHDPIEITAHHVLLLVEAIKEWFTSSPNVLRLQSAQGSLVETCDPLGLVQ